jgi:hypothetical protein
MAETDSGGIRKVGERRKQQLSVCEMGSIECRFPTVHVQHPQGPISNYAINVSQPQGQLGCV